MDNNLIVSIPKERSYFCVIMPAYNEGMNIKQNLLRTSEILSGFIKNYSIIAVNDGSTDLTYEGILEAAKVDSHIHYISYSENGGKGHAICTGVSYADAQYIGFLDSDLELNPIMFRSFLRAMQEEEADIAIGSKLHKKSKLHYPISRRIMSFGYYVMLKMLFRLKLHDTQTGIKLFKDSVIKPICEKLTTKGFAFDIEILAMAAANGNKIIEMPIQLNYSRNKTTKSKISIKQTIHVFQDTLRIRKQIRNKR